jgi:hypothetical protein
MEDVMRAEIIARLRARNLVNKISERVTCEELSSRPPVQW